MAPPAQASTTPTAAPRRAGVVRRSAGALVGGAILLWCAWSVLMVFVVLDRRPRTDDANVTAHLVGVAARVPGYVSRVAVVDNQEVKQGDLLIEIDARPFELALADAKARLALTELEVAESADLIRAAQATIEARQAEREYAAQYLARIEPLLARQFVTPDQVDEARRNLRVAEAKIAEAVAELRRAESALGQLGDVNVRIAAAVAAVERAQLDLDYCVIRSPVDGFVTNMALSPGRFVHPGDELFALVDTSQWFVVANFIETEIERVQPGAEVEVWLMAYPGRRFKGTVQGLAWAVKPSWTRESGLVPAPDPTLDWVRLAQRFPVRIILEPFNPDAPYRMGATATAIINTEKRRPVPRWVERVTPGWLRGVPLMPEERPPGSDL
ncbi:MAG: efflux RND transporter periplasmic adaptor subunit [Phycisphaeraceae bacterium]|nr:efflux RND transporter periplasmic adaptor subunit [Phycisphaeraceae bacterium]